MDFSSISTPAQLVEQNQKEPVVTDAGERCIQLLEDVLEEGPAVGLCMVKILIEKLVGMHQANVDDEYDDKEDALLWQTDLVKLQMVASILEDVEV